MNVGHLAVAVGATRAVPRLNVGWLVFAAMLADFLLGVFASLGLEHANVPADYASRHYLTFSFPFSHGLLPLIAWSVCFGFLVSRVLGVDRWRVFFVVSAVAFSHFVLDALVHVSGLPLAGENSPKVGLGLWKHMPLELSLETLMALAGVVIYLRAGGADSGRGSRWGIPVFLAVLTAMTWTQLLVSVPPRPADLIPGWIAAPLVFAVIAYLCDRKRVARANRLLASSEASAQ
jgi:hypothetical protein